MPTKTCETCGRDTTHNGWTNYETWAVNLWIGNEESTWNYWIEAAKDTWIEAMRDATFSRRDNAKFALADRLKEEIEDGSPIDDPSLYMDLLNAALSEVHWQEIAEVLISNIPEAN